MHDKHVWLRSLQSISWLTLCVFAVCLFEPHVAGEGRQAPKHGYRVMLPELGLAKSPQQASADVFL